MRITLFVTTLLVLILMSGRDAVACDCMTPSPEESFRHADLVFEGEVIRAPRSSDGGPTTYTFRVDKVLKGPRVKEVTIFHGGTDCDATFFADIVYRVYAHEYKGKLMSGACSGNVLLRKKPVIASYPPLETVSVWQLWYVKVVSIATVALVLILLVHLITKKHATLSYQKNWKRSKILKNQL